MTLGCPHCGEDSARLRTRWSIDHARAVHWVECWECGAEARDALNEYDALDEWEERAA